MVGKVDVDVEALREAIKEEYKVVASQPDKGFHFHTGRPLTRILEYSNEWLSGIPETSIEAFAGTGNPFRLGEIAAGEKIVDIGAGAGIDSMIAAKLVGDDGEVVGVDMTPAMLERARRAAREAGKDNVRFVQGHAEELPVEDEWADVVISNGVLNLVPDKTRAVAEMYRVLKPGGRLQIGDILVERAVPEDAKKIIDLWTG